MNLKSLIKKKRSRGRIDYDLEDIPHFNNPLWKDMYTSQIELFRQIRENLNPLRFNNKCIRVSDISDQYYCEKKVELAYLHGDIETEPKILGRDAHDKLIEDYEEITLKKKWKRIFSSPRLMLSESLFFAKYNGLFFMFRADRILFERGIPKILIEFKFSKYQRPFLSYRVQLQAEALLLKEIGFNTDELYYSIIIAPSDIERDSSFLNQIPTIIYNQLPDHEEGVLHLNFGDINAYTYQFDVIEAKKKIKWAMEYWNNEREAVATDNKNKCKRCEYNDSCKT